MGSFRKHFIYLLLLSLVVEIQAQPSSGFIPGKEGSKPGGAESPQEREDRMRKEAKNQDEEKGENKPDPDAKPLTKRQRARKLRKQEKERKKAYYSHQNRIQDPRVRYRMNNNEKRSQRFNDRSNAPWWRKFQFNHRKRNANR